MACPQPSVTLNAVNRINFSKYFSCWEGPNKLYFMKYSVMLQFIKKRSQEALKLHITYYDSLQSDFL